MVHSNRMLTINPKHGLDVHVQYSAIMVCSTTPDCLLHPLLTRMLTSLATKILLSLCQVLF